MLVCAAALVGLIGGCQSVNTTAPGAIGVERRQSMLVSEAQMEQSAAQAYAAELNKAREKGQLNTDTAQLQRVRTISDRLIKQTPVFRPDAASWQWQVDLQTSKDVNAYCMPGGRIMVYTGLIEQLKVTDAELATVIGHEIAHALREHSREAVSRAYAQQLGLGALGALAGLGSGSLQLAGMISEVTFSLPRSRLQETEADRVGLELMARAGYDPQAALSLWRKMAEHKQSGSSDFLSTHPSDASRLSDLGKLMPRVQPLYQATQRPPA